MTKEFKVGQKVRAKITLENDLQEDGIGVQLCASAGDELIIRKISSGYRNCISVSHEGITDRAFCVHESEIEPIDEAIASLEDDLHHFQEDNPYLKNAIRAALSEQSAPFITADSVVKDDLITETLSDEDILRMSIECGLCDSSYLEGKYVTEFGDARESILKFAHALLKA